MHQIFVFADGACTGNPGPGGWGAIIATPDGQVTELGGFQAETTNNRMELTAVGKALRHLEKQPGEIRVYTDSKYVINGITKWVWGWRKNGWKTAQATDVANVEFWKALMSILAGRQSAFGENGKVDWKYVPGHSGVPGNERVDEIAVGFARGKRPLLYSGPLLRYEIPVFDGPLGILGDEEEFPVAPDSPSSRREPKKAAYSYLSLVGGLAERHESWAECERRIKGVSRAKFKKATSVADEKAILESWGVSLEEKKRH